MRSKSSFWYKKFIYEKLSSLNKSKDDKNYLFNIYLKLKIYTVKSERINYNFLANK